MARATTIRFSDEVFARLDQASVQTGLPVNSIVVAACLEWMQRHALAPVGTPEPQVPSAGLLRRPRWATLRRAVKLSIAEPSGSVYPFERFTTAAKKSLTRAQAEAEKSGDSYIGTEHLLLAAFADSDSDAARILSSLDVKEPEARTAIHAALHHGAPMGSRRMAPTARVKKVIEIAFQMCGAGGEPAVRTGHVLAALVAEGDGIAAHVLQDFGVTAEKIAAAMEALTEPET